MLAKTILIALATGLVTEARAAPASTEAVGATCTTGVAASVPSFDIKYVNVSSFLPTALSNKNYEPDRTWAAKHAIHTTYLGLTAGGGMDDYGAFKCQYTCNGEQGCVSYFGRYVQIGTNQEHFACITYDALLDESLFVEDADPANLAVGGFDKLCNATKA